MTENPYRPPVYRESSRASSPLPFSFAPTGEVRLTQPHCPMGIAILSVLHVLFGVFMILNLIVFLGWMETPRIYQLLVQVGVNPALMLARIGLVCAFLLASGAGMWLAKSWAWWLGGYVYSYGIFGRLVVIANHARYPDLFPNADYTFAKSNVLAVVFSLIFLYLLRREVREYFRLEKFPVGGAVAMLAVAGFIMNAAFIAAEILI